MCNKITSIDDLPRPTPTPSYEAYVQERELCLSLDKKKSDNYKKYIKAKRISSLSYLPTKIDIENVSRCNYRCVMCQVSDWEKGQRSTDLSYEDYKDIVDEQYGLVEIKLQGMGEPLLGKDDLFKMIAYARLRHIWVRIATNASLLHLNNNYKKLIDSGVNEVQISFDGPNKEIFEKIRPGSKFDKVVDNCKLINDYCDKKNVLRTKMWVVVQRDNLPHLINLVDMANKMGFKKLVFSFDIGSWGNDVWGNKISKLSVHNEFNLETALELITQGSKYGIDVAFWNVTDKFSTKSIESLCPWPFERSYISSDMRAVPCCMIGNPDTFEIAKIKNSFSSVWNSASYEKFREAHISGQIPEVCKSCYL